MGSGGSGSGEKFVHLHVHTEYSMLDGAARLTDLFRETNALGMPALAITDHGNLFGAHDFATKAAAAGVKPIIGTEAYLAPGSRFDRRVGDNAKIDKYSHLTLWATNAAGYANLIKLSSLASLEGYYYKPRMDRELLARYADGVIGTTGCPGGEVSQLLVRGDYAGAKRAAGAYSEIFGRGNYYVELMQHGIDIERQTFPGLVKIAKELNLPLVATNDLHYTAQADSVAHEVLLCVQTGATIADPTGARRAQVDYELTVINQMGFPSYFLIVADLVRHAKENGIRVGPGRGSAAGCTVSYCLGITELDPLRYGLIFERFLNPERVSMPDIDMDFDERRRGDMIRYATERYGDDRVAQIVTFGTIKAKQAIKDSARVLGFPYAVGDRLTKLLPQPVMGRDVCLADCFDPTAPRYGEAGELRAALDVDPDVRRVLETARGLEGLKRQAGVHAAGVVICRDPLTDHIPVWRREADGAVITQFDMGTCEQLGLLKMDFLGLRNLTVLDDCLAHIEANRGETVRLEDLPLDDPEAYALLCRGESIGVFQLEGGPMRSLMRSLQPDCFEDISALIALYRPGPMGVGAHIDFVERKHGRRQVSYLHPDLESILGETYGVVVYQEQVITIAQKMAGYTLGHAGIIGGHEIVELFGA